MRNCGRFCSFYFACVQHFPFCSNSNLQTSLQSCLQAICCTASSLSSYFAIQDAEEVLHFCIHFLSPQAAEALQVAAREAREVSVAITCVEPRSPHAQAARGRISSMEHRERGKLRICACFPFACGSCFTALLTIATAGVDGTKCRASLRMGSPV